MTLEEKIEQWKKEIEQAEEYGLFFDASTVKDIVNELVKVRTKYKNLVTGIINSIEDNRSL